MNFYSLQFVWFFFWILKKELGKFGFCSFFTLGFIKWNYEFLLLSVLSILNFYEGTVF